MLIDLDKEEIESLIEALHVKQCESVYNDFDTKLIDKLEYFLQ